MKMNKTAAAITAGIITFGAMASASAAGIGFVNSGALLQAHPKMEKVQLDMRTAAQKAQENFNSRSAGKSDQEKEQIAQESSVIWLPKKELPCSRFCRISAKRSSRFVRKKDWMSFWKPAR